MKNKKIVAAVAAVAAAAVCLIAVLIVKLGNENPTVTPADASATAEAPQSTAGYEFPSYTAAPSKAASETPAAETSTAKSGEKITEKLTDRVTTAVQAVTELTTLVNAKFSEVFTMPHAPKYIPPDSKIDFDKAKIASYKYDPEGNYYYTDDKACWQSNFGFNEAYDRLAVVGVIYYDTVRTKFTYGGKEWLIQIWKGQYGYYFVGGEVGVYTRPIGKKGTGYSCAAKEDWLKMEMTFLWDETKTGNYEPELTRPYTEYWWCTGFVVGFEADESLVTREQFRLISHITFKDTEMANAFCKAFEANGFKRVAKLNNNVKDTFVQVGPDVAFVWQSINQHII
jgi:hypothetical protein